MLRDAVLWRTLDAIGSEMMYTVRGRRLFPAIQISIAKLDPFQYYAVGLSLRDIDGRKYRYDGQEKKWVLRSDDEY